MNPVAESTPVTAKADAKTISVLLVDDHTSIRQMLAFILPREGPFEIIGEVSTGAEAIAKCRELQPKLVVVDLMLPEMSGIEVVRMVRQELRETKMLIYSGTNSGELIAEAMSARPHGYVHKEDTLDVLREALRAVTAGRNYFTQVAADHQNRLPAGRLGLLTERERAVLRLIARGCTNKEIADQLSMAVKTVETHRSNLANKLEIYDVASLTHFAIRHGVVPLE